MTTTRFANWFSHDMRGMCQTVSRFGLIGAQCVNLGHGLAADCGARLIVQPSRRRLRTHSRNGGANAANAMTRIYSGKLFRDWGYDTTLVTPEYGLPPPGNTKDVYTEPREEKKRRKKRMIEIYRKRVETNEPHEISIFFGEENE